MKNCKRCDIELIGELIFYPELCQDCVIDLSLKEDKSELGKYEKNYKKTGKK